MHSSPAHGAGLPPETRLPALSRVHLAEQRLYFEGGAAVVDVWRKALVKAKIQVVFDVFHGGRNSVMCGRGCGRGRGRGCAVTRALEGRRLGTASGRSNVEPRRSDWLWAAASPYRHPWCPGTAEDGRAASHSFRTRRVGQRIHPGMPWAQQAGPAQDRYDHG